MVRPVTVSAAHVASIVGLVEAASDLERAAGLLWYKSFGAAVVAYGEAGGMPALTSVGIFAALSPQLSIQRNWALFKAIVDTGRADAGRGALGCQLRKVARYLVGDLEFSGLVRGNKVSSFANNLLGNHDCVTVDRHAYAAALGYPMERLSIGHKLYRDLEAAYQTAAGILGIAPAEAQAIVWVVWRRMQGIQDTGGMHLVA